MLVCVVPPGVFDARKTVLNPGRGGVLAEELGCLGDIY